jgi:hypothetical protein
MTTTHTLKIWPAPFEALRTGRKRFEWRQDDRGFGEGHLLVLREWDPETKAYSGRELIAEVGYVLRGGFGMPGGYCVMSLEDVKEHVPERHIPPRVSRYTLPPDEDGAWGYDPDD